MKTLALGVALLLSSSSSWGEYRDYSDREARDRQLAQFSGFRHELVISATSGRVSFGGGSTSVGAGIAYGYLLAPPIEFQIQSAFTLTSLAGSSVYAVSFLPGVTVNFPETDMTNDLFAGANLGFLLIQGSGNSSTRFAFQLEAGKRFSIFPKVVYRPSVLVSKVAETDLVITLQLLAFALVF